MMKHFAGDKLGTGMSLFMVGGEMARALGPLVLSAILEYYYLGTASLLLVGVVLLTMLFWNRFNTESIAEDYSPKQNKKNGIKDVLKRNKKLYLVLAVIILAKTFFTASLSAFLPTFLTFKGVGIAKAGFALAVLEIAGAAGTFLAGSLSDKFGRFLVLKIAVIVAPLLYVVFLLSPGAWVLALLVLLGLTVFAVNPIIMALIQENEKDYPAAANSIYMTMNFAFSFSILYLIGLIGDIWSLDTAYTVCSVVGFSSIPFVFILPKIKIKN
jgi:FSR family fosmidomycin resistance protein-like MFS transporter